MSHLDRPSRARTGARALGVLGAVVALGLLPAGPAAAADFGTAPLTGPGLRADAPGAAVRTVTVGRHATFDRVVFTAETRLPRWEVRYVPSVKQDGSGTPVPLDGDADLFVVMRGTLWASHPSQPRYLTPRYPGLRQVSAAGEFEGDLSYGIGQATRAGFRAFQLTGPNRLVVDVAHPAGATAPPAASPAAAPGDRPAGPGSTPGTGTGSRTATDPRTGTESRTGTGTGTRTVTEPGAGTDPRTGTGAGADPRTGTGAGADPVAGRDPRAGGDPDAGRDSSAGGDPGAQGTEPAGTGLVDAARTGVPDPVADGSSGASHSVWLIGGGLLLIGALTAAGVLLHVRRLP